jgi:uncharacterized YigZ family protein
MVLVEITPPASFNDPPDSLRTLAGEANAEFKERRSRFIAMAWPAASEAAAADLIAEAARRYHDSRHVCYAWRLGMPPHIRENRNDAGEPSGTAGEPILQAIRKVDLVDVLVVVVRYFGGIKLGTGGLSRAYGRAADEALAAATVKEVLLGREFKVGFPYSFQKTVRHLLTMAEGRIVDEQYSDDVAWKIWLPHSRWRTFEGQLIDATAGAVALRSVPEDSSS